MSEANLGALWRWLLEPLVTLIIHLAAKVDGVGWFSERHGCVQSVGGGGGDDLLV